ncbi:MAG: hypothetical protein ACK40D_03135 [Cyanobacteriota bacterium]
MSSPVSQPSLPDWQALLLEAIQQRDAPQAILLAQRYVHRYGMKALDTLLEKVKGESGQDGDARDWLLPLLIHPFPQQEPLPMPGETAEADCSHLEFPATQASTHPLPVEELQPPSRPAISLDEVFAPLEIAFPPLPEAGLEPEQVLAHQEPLAVAVSPGGPLAHGGSDQEPDQAIVQANLGEDQDPAEPVDDPSPLDSLEVAVAAPVPAFQLEEPTPRQPPAHRARHSESSERRASRRPAPISPALAPWLAWLNDAGRSLPRS